MLSNNPGRTGKKVPKIPMINKIRQRILINAVSISLIVYARYKKVALLKSHFACLHYVYD